MILVYVLVNILLLLFVSFIPTTSIINTAPIYVNAVKMGASINCVAITIVMMPVGGQR